MLCVAQGGQPGRQRLDVRQLRLGGIELPHVLLDQIRGGRHQLRGFGGQRRSGPAQSLDQSLQRGKQPHQGFDVDHGDGAMQGVHRAQQVVFDRDRLAGVGQRGPDGLQILGDFAAQDLEQDRVHRRHRRQRNGFLRRRLRRLRRYAGETGIVEQGGRRGIGVDGRQAPAHRAAHGLGTGRRHDLLHRRPFARGQAIGHLHDRRQRRLGRGAVGQRPTQLRQRGDRMPDQCHDIVVWRDGPVEHTIEHVLDLPGEFAEHARTDQPPGTLQGMERAPDRHQQRLLFGRHAPGTFGSLEMADFLADFLEKDGADLIVDVLATPLEAGLRREWIGDGTLLDDGFLDLGPILIRCRRRHALFRLHQAQAGEVLPGLGRHPGFTEEQGLGGVTRRQTDRFVQDRHRRRLGPGRGCGRSGRLEQGTRLRQGPIAELAQAVFGHVQNVIETATMLARGLQVVLERGQGVGQVIHLRGARHPLLDQQLVADEAADAFGQVGRAHRRKHAQCAGDLVHQHRHAVERVVPPTRFHERDDGVLDLGGIAHRLLHQRGQDVPGLAARQQRSGLVGRVLVRAQAVDVVVERGFDVEQRAGHVEQGFLVGGPRSADDLGEHAALLADHPPRHAQGEHTERVADAFEHRALHAERGRIRVRLAQEQVERILDPQQVLLQRLGDRIEQRAVVPGHGTTRMLEFGGVRQHAVQPVHLPQQLHLWAALGCLGDEIEQLPGQIIGIAAAQAFLAAVEQLADVAVHPADQPTDFTGLAFQQALFEAFQHGGGDPPDPPSRYAPAAGADAQQGLTHASQPLCRLLVAEPGQEMLLEADTQLGDLAQMPLGLAGLGGARHLGRQRRLQVGHEQRGLRQGLLIARRPQLVEQRQQDHRHVPMAARESLQIVGQLHQPAHQGGIGIVATIDATGEQRQGERFHLLGDQRRPVQLHHAQDALHLVQPFGTVAHRLGHGGTADVGLERLAGAGQRLVELRLDPLQGGEIDVFLESHACLLRLRNAARNRRGCRKVPPLNPAV